ncbi:MAG: (d)CMP kinase [Bacteroidota bacterium]
MEKIIVAIDGYSSCGKSTLAKALANALQYLYIDTGAMYRATTLFFLENRIDLQDARSVQKALASIKISFQLDSVAGNQTYLNNRHVEEDIRTMRVSEMVSPVATISAVRRAMVQQQQALGAQKGIVMDGRDIGTVVFPEAELKIFLTADPQIRALRRQEELAAKGQQISLDEILKNLLERDRIDSTRADSPLKQAEDAVLIDNSNITFDELLSQAVKLAKERIS